MDSCRLLSWRRSAAPRPFTWKKRSAQSRPESAPTSQLLRVMIQSDSALQRLFRPGLCDSTVMNGEQHDENQ